MPCSEVNLINAMWSSHLGEITYFQCALSELPFIISLRQQLSESLALASCPFTGRRFLVAREYPLCSIYCVSNISSNAMLRRAHVIAVICRPPPSTRCTLCGASSLRFHCCLFLVALTLLTQLRANNNCQSESEQYRSNSKSVSSYYATVLARYGGPRSRARRALRD